jgi:hypothetical protein
VDEEWLEKTRIDENEKKTRWKRLQNIKYLETQSTRAPDVGIELVQYCQVIRFYSRSWLMHVCHVACMHACMPLGNHALARIDEYLISTIFDIVFTNIENYMSVIKTFSGRKLVWNLIKTFWLRACDIIPSFDDKFHESQCMNSELVYQDNDDKILILSLEHWQYSQQVPMPT